MPPRCPNGTRRNKKTGECEKSTGSPKKACPRGSRRNPATHRCKKTKATTPVKAKQARCPKGTRRNKKTGECESANKLPTPPPKLPTPPPKLPTPKKFSPVKSFVSADAEMQIMIKYFNMTENRVNRLKDVLCENLYYDVRGECVRDGVIKETNDSGSLIIVLKREEYEDGGWFTEENARESIETSEGYNSSFTIQSIVFVGGRMPKPKSNTSSASRSSSKTMSSESHTSIEDAPKPKPKTMIRVALDTQLKPGKDFDRLKNGLCEDLLYDADAECVSHEVTTGDPHTISTVMKGHKSTRLILTLQPQEIDDGVSKFNATHIKKYLSHHPKSVSFRVIYVSHVM